MLALYKLRITGNQEKNHRQDANFHFVSRIDEADTEKGAKKEFMGSHLAIVLWWRKAPAGCPQPARNQGLAPVRASREAQRHALVSCRKL